MKKRIFSFLMALVMVLSILPMPALAADGLCEHHPEHIDCNYVAPVEGQPCSHEGKCSADTCGYVPAQPGGPCGHKHDETCGWSAGKAEVPCDKGCAEVDENGVIIHVEGCAYAPTVAETACSHQCSSEVCGYVAPVEGVKCGHEHDGTCGYVQAVDGGSCGFVCSQCAQQSDPDQGEASCTCDVPCNEMVNADCPVCSVSTEGCNGKAAEDVPTCNCQNKCTAETVKTDCPVCGAEHADLSGCIGAPAPVCNCADQCTAEKVKADCPVCGGEHADLTACKGTPAPAVTENAKAVQAMIDALPTLAEVQAMTMEEQGNIYNQTQAAYEAYKLLTEEERAQVDVSKFEALFGYFNTLTSPLPDDGPVSVTEQYPGITNGNTYWFDLSGQKANLPGKHNDSSETGTLPDGTMHWVPFDYAGTVNAYKRTAADDTGNDVTTYAHSLFIAQNNLTLASWTDLNNKGLIFGTANNYTNGGISYTLRAPSVGSTPSGSPGNWTGITPDSNEWDAIRIKITNWNGNTNYIGQDIRSSDSNYCIQRTKSGAIDTGATKETASYYLPVLEIQSGTPKVVTVNLNGGKIGETTPANPINLVVSASGFTAPSGKGLKPPTETDAANLKAFLGWKGSDDKIYAAGASVPDTVTTLTAQWVESLTTYNIWVGNKQVEFIKKDDVLGGADEGATVTYDPITNTLTLNGANISNTGTFTDGNNASAVAGIRATGDLNIVLTGNNTVATSTSDANAYGIYTGGDLTISGTGTINAKASSTGEQVSYGMCANTVTISGGKGTASGESGAVSGTLSFQDGITYEGEQTDNSMTWGYGENEAFTVAYDVNGGTGSVPKGGSYLANTSVTVQNKTSNMEKTGHTFAGWNTSAEGTGASYAAGDTFQITADTTLYAKWTADPVTVESVSLNKDKTTLTVGGTETLTATVKPDNATNKAVTWKSGDETVATVDANGKVTALKAGSATITVTTVDGGKEATCAVTVTSAACTHSFVWTAKDNVLTGKCGLCEKETVTATITAENAVYDGEEHKTATVAYSKNWKLGELEIQYDPAKPVEVGTVKASISMDTTKTREIVTASTTYKITKPTFTVSFDSNGGPSVPSQTVESGGKVVEPKDPTRSKYTFKGWYTDEKYTKAYDFDTEVTSSFTLYAKWKRTSTAWWDNPKTGDYIMIAVGVLVVSGAALAGLLVYSKKRKK